MSKRGDLSSSKPQLRALVTGGAGFLGTHLCRSLIEDGWNVLCVDNLSTSKLTAVEALVGHNFEFRCVDITAGLESVGHVDCVFHLASLASPVAYTEFPIETLRAGSEGTRNALEVALKYDARFIMASTSEVYGDPQVHPQPEDYWGAVNPVGVRSMYDESKRYAEALCTAYRSVHGVKTGIVRIFNTYGPGMGLWDGRVVSTFVRQALNNETLTVAGDGLQTRSLCYVDDLVKGLREMARSHHAGPINLGNDEERSVVSIAEDVLFLTKSRSKISYVERPGDDPQLRRPDLSRARAMLGWDPVTEWQDGLERTISWARQQ